MDALLDRKTCMQNFDSLVGIITVCTAVLNVFTHDLVSIMCVISKKPYLVERFKIVM